MARKPLRVVSDDEQAPKKPTTILEAAEQGSRLDELKMMRRRIAKAMDDFATPARDLAALSRRQLEISREIESIEKAAEGDDIGRAADTPDEKWDASAI
jgi:hypothetical protein